ncbi:hypothetical protein MAL08_02885 [Leptospira noguchii]|uniref:hypothetical protein n=1 Tax=Leptospira noguchii TaxID=28182 RepID=UPI001FB84618|nr:hypothetical protein [Leptospira noguchii]UOG38305.1 hypothetical protein MAL08_02885 [Leptospira noguchii]
MSYHPKLGKTKAECFPELSVSLLGSLYGSRSKTHKFYRGICRNSDRFISRSKCLWVGYAKIAITTSL